jgi:hypothetical protein
MATVPGSDNLIIVNRDMLLIMLKDAVNEGALLFSEATTDIGEEVDTIAERVLSAQIFPPVVDRTQD